MIEGTIDSIDAAVRRKKAVSDPERLEALYYVYQNEEVFRDDLPTDEIQPLLDNNLLARIPYPDGREKIRITNLGRDELPQSFK